MNETGRAIEQDSRSKLMVLDLKPASVVTEDVDSIRSKFVLSKAVEGLETLPIVTSSQYNKASIHDGKGRLRPKFPIQEKTSK